MNSKRIFSVILSLVLLFSTMSIAVSAEGEPGVVYSATTVHELTPNGSVSEQLFGVDLSIDESKYACFDGGSTKWDKEVTSIVVSYKVTNIDGTEGETITADYLVDPEAFFAVFARQEEDRVAIAELNKTIPNKDNHHPPVEFARIIVGFNIMFEDPNVFGSLDYTVKVNVMEPMSMEIPFVGNILDAARLPAVNEVSGNVWSFPQIDKTTLVIDKRPDKTAYYDNEIFELTGTKISFTTRRALSNDANTAYVPVGEGSVTYKADTSNNDANAHMFTCHPQRGTKLTTDNHSVTTYFDGLEIGKTPVVVKHKWSDGPVGITTDKWTQSKPGYHAIVCEGCGETKDASNHVVADEEGWTPNNDQTFVGNGTESNTCADCGATLIRDALGSADYNDALANYHFIRVILDYVNLILRIIGAAGIN